MFDLFKIYVRNLIRYKRRTFLTASLIAIGVIFVLVFISVSGSFKNLIIGQVTDSMLGHMQIHRKDYVASLDSLPLTMNLKSKAVERVERLLKQMPEIKCYSKRIKFGGMFSNFAETTNIRLNGVWPENEFKTVPLLQSRILKGDKGLKKGEVLERTVWLTDVVPTICYLSEIPVPKDTEGAVIYQALENPNMKLEELQKLRKNYQRLKNAVEKEKQLTHTYNE